MAEPEVRISAGATDDNIDVDMQGNDNGDVLEIGETNVEADAPGNDVEEQTLMETEKPATRVTFVE